MTFLKLFSKCMCKIKETINILKSVYMIIPKPFCMRVCSPSIYIYLSTPHFHTLFCKESFLLRYLLDYGIGVDLNGFLFNVLKIGLGPRISRKSGGKSIMSLGD